MKLEDLASILQTRGFPVDIDGAPDLDVVAVNTLQDAQPGEISFLSNSKYRDRLMETDASAVIVKPDQETRRGLCTLRCADPYGAVTAAMVTLHGYRRHTRWGVDERASIAASAQIGPNPSIGPFVTVAEAVVIGKNATIYPGCYVGAGVCIGDDVTLYPNVTVYERVRMGDRVAIHAGTVIGQDGLGYAPVDQKWLKIPQVGSVVIEDDVEMGACCAIDRATLGETRIEQGTKISDAVVIGHGTRVGRDSILVAQVGIAGSVDVGEHVTLMGQVGIAGHLHIGDDATVLAKSGVWSNIGPGETYFGLPATDSVGFRRNLVITKSLPKMARRVRELERQVDELRRLLEDKPD